MGKTPDVAEVAHRLGMKPAEVTQVELDAAGVLAQTIDGNWTLIRADGFLEFLGKEVPHAEAEPEPVKAPARPRKAAK